MRLFLAGLLYTALTLSANADPAALNALKEGDMRKLRVHDVAQAVPAGTFLGEDGAEMSLQAYKGKVVVLNFWATWCAPCRHEMPQLSQLQAELGGDDLQVVTIATGRNEPAAMKVFFEEIGVNNLPLHRDPRQSFARDMGVLGLPVTLILGRDGLEIARLRGDADWASDSAKAILTAIIEK